MHTRLSIVAFLAAGIVALAEGRASACNDGAGVNLGRVNARFGGVHAWTRDFVKSTARWGARIDALLPAGVRVDAWASTQAPNMQLCPLVGACSDNDPDGAWESLESLFATVASLTHASPAQVARAKAKDVQLFTVQIFAAHNRGDAQWKKGRIEQANVAIATDDWSHLHGVVGVHVCGGAAEWANVVEERDSANRPIHRILVGAFLSTTEADEARVILRAAGFADAFVRAL